MLVLVVIVGGVWLVSVVWVGSLVLVEGLCLELGFGVQLVVGYHCDRVEGGHAPAKGRERGRYCTGVWESGRAYGCGDVHEIGRNQALASSPPSLEQITSQTMNPPFQVQRPPQPTDVHQAAQWQALNTDATAQRAICHAAATGQLTQDQMVSFSAWIKGNGSAFRLYQIERQALQQHQPQFNHLKSQLLDNDKQLSPQHVHQIRECTPVPLQQLS